MTSNNTRVIQRALFVLASLYVLYLTLVTSPRMWLPITPACSSNCSWQENKLRALEQMIRGLSIELGSNNLTDIKSDSYNGLTIPKYAARVGDPIKSHEARHVLLHSSWRSGSTFMGQLLSTYPGVFYNFEPLSPSYGSGQKMNQGAQRLAKETLLSMFKCRGAKTIKLYWEFVAKHWPHNNQFIKDNTRYYPSCMDYYKNISHCYQPDMFLESCRLHPIRLAKTVRQPLPPTEYLFKDPELPNFKMIVLLRDPRGIMNSRDKSSWCSEPQCSNVNLACDRLHQDTLTAFKFAQRYPGKVYIVRYEDIALQPYEEVGKIMDFLGLPWMELIDDYIKEHTIHSGKARTKRNSKERVSAWARKLTWKRLNEIQKSCTKAMKILGYKKITDKKQLENNKGNFKMFVNVTLNNRA